MFFNFSNPISWLNDSRRRNSHVQDGLKIDSVYKIEMFSNLTLLGTNGKTCMNFTDELFHSFMTKAPANLVVTDQDNESQKGES